MTKGCVWTLTRREGGSVSFQARRILKRGGEVFREAWTFERRELSTPGAILEEKAKAADVTLAEATDRDIAEFTRKIGRLKAQVW